MAGGGAEVARVDGVLEDLEDDTFIDDVFMAGVFADDEPGACELDPTVVDDGDVAADHTGASNGGGHARAHVAGSDVARRVRGPALRAVVDRAGGGAEGVQALARHVVPTVLATDRRFEVTEEIEALLPGGVERGSTIGCRGPGATSLAFAIAAGPVATGSWMAVIGGEQLNLAALEQVGVALHRTIVIAEPPPGSWGAVASALVDAFDVVVTATNTKIPLRDVRRIDTRLRDRGGIVIDVGHQWPEAHDLELRVVDQSWAGLGRGHGVLTARQVQVAVSGRRGVRPRSSDVWLPGSGPFPLMALEDAGTDAAVFAGSDADELVGIDDVTPLRRVG